QHTVLKIDVMSINQLRPSQWPVRADTSGEQNENRIEEHMRGLTHRPLPVSQVRFLSRRPALVSRTTKSSSASEMLAPCFCYDDRFRLYDA
ncbi:hypothetical protein ACCS96_51240, partial [Rhizobium ruizarguesonis]